VFDPAPAALGKIVHRQIVMRAMNVIREVMMKSLKVRRLLPSLVLALALGLLLAPAAYAHGGSVSHHYASPPLDAGSDVPNPAYAFPVSPGSQVRPDNQASRPLMYGPQREVGRSEGSTAEGFDWSDAAIGAAGTFALVLVATGSVIMLRSHRRHPATA
jgi:hypothetical protein